MKALIFLNLFIFSTTVLAQIPSGTWRGVVSSKAYCFMDVGETAFKKNFSNPLNEYVSITIGTIVYEAKHPFHLNPIDGTITVDQRLFESVVPTPTGAYALQIHLETKENKDFPKDLTVMEDNWNNNFREVITCKDFVKVY
jgi:hypothetical protein